MESTCAKHPNNPAPYRCLKYNRHLCAECLGCQDPKLYCRYRTMCVIWEETREIRRNSKRADALGK